MKLIVPELPDILIAVGPGVATLAVSRIVPPLPDILVTVGSSEDT